jgi:hypothetical protein
LVKIDLALIAPALESALGIIVLDFALAGARKIVVELLLRRRRNARIIELKAQ